MDGLGSKITAALRVKDSASSGFSAGSCASVVGTLASTWPSAGGLGTSGTDGVSLVLRAGVATGAPLPRWGRPLNLRKLRIMYKAPIIFNNDNAEWLHYFVTSSNDLCNLVWNNSRRTMSALFNRISSSLAWAGSFGSVTTHADSIYAHDFTFGQEIKKTRFG